MSEQTVTVYKDAPCSWCDGSGLCSDCGTGDCDICQGTGVSENEIGIDMTLVEYEAHEQLERQKVLLKSVYGTAKPESIQDYWLRRTSYSFTGPAQYLAARGVLKDEH